MESVKRFIALCQTESDPTSVPLSTIMRVATATAHYLLGLLMTMGGLNDFLHFAHHPLPTLLLAKQYMEDLLNSRYMMGGAIFHGFAGIVLLINWFVTSALTILAAIIINLLLYHVTLEAEGFGAAIVVLLLWIVVFIRDRTSFRKLFKA